MRAYVTVLTSQAYIGGVNRLIKSLIKVKSKYPLYVLIPSGKEELIDEILKMNYSIECLVLSPMNIESGTNYVEYWRDTLFKLRVFSLKQFSKIVFLDSDMIVLKNIDHLFDSLHMSAVASGAVLHSDWENQLNSGLMVIEPNEKEYEGLLDCIQEAQRERLEMNYGFGDQDVIKKYYNDWPQQHQLHLDERYNCLLGYGELLKMKGMIKSVDNIYVYHFTGKEKPWRGIKEKVLIAMKIIRRNGKFINSIDFEIYRRYLKQ